MPRKNETKVIKETLSQFGAMICNNISTEQQKKLLHMSISKITINEL